jgi:hypothetical protein
MARSPLTKGHCQRWLLVRGEGPYRPQTSPPAGLHSKAQFPRFVDVWSNVGALLEVRQKSENRRFWHIAEDPL